MGTSESTLSADMDEIKKNTTLKTISEDLGSDVKYFYPLDLAPLDIAMGGGIACLVGETKIPLLSGVSTKIQDLVGLNEFWVYSCKPDGTIVPGRGTDARVTGEVTELVKVTLDNGESVTCTPDHLWMTRDGNYKEAQDLVDNESLMPLYFTESPGRWSLYPSILDNTTGKSKLFHQVVVKELLGGYKGRQVCHHKDFNPGNNNPNNLELMDEEIHKKIYSELSSERLKAQEERVKGEEQLHLSSIGGHNFQKPEIVELVSEQITSQNNKIVNVACPDCDREFKKQASYYAHRKVHVNEQQVSNHKVVSIERIVLQDPIPVYDITVDSYHNFATEAGTFIHNSGKIIEIFGWESTGKSTIALEYSKAFTQFWESKKDEKFIVLWIETESALDKVRAKWIGCNMEKFLICEAETLEEGFNTIKSTLEKSSKLGVKLFIVWDTIAAAPTQSEIEKGDNSMGMTYKPRVIRAQLRQITPLLGKTDSTLILVNQVYQIIGSYTGGCESPGGGGIKFHSSVRAQISKKEEIKKLTVSGEEEVEAIVSEVYTKKNKLTNSGLRVKIVINGERGIDRFESIYRFLVANKLVVVKGGWKQIEFEGEQISFQNTKTLKELIETKYPRLPVYMDYLVYKHFCSTSPLMKAKLLMKLWEYEIEFEGSKITELTTEELEIAKVLYTESQLESETPSLVPDKLESGN